MHTQNNQLRQVIRVLQDRNEEIQQRKQSGNELNFLLRGLNIPCFL